MQKYQINQEDLIADDKAEIIEHLNKDHSSELISVAKAFSEYKEVETCQIISIEDDFCRLAIGLPTKEQKQIEVKFTAEGDHTEKMLFLAYEASIKNRENLMMPTNSAKNQYFEFIDKEKIGKNFIRLKVKSYEPLSEDYAGLAYSFKLQNLKTIPEKKQKTKKTKTSQKMSFFEHKYMSLLLFITKRLSASQRRTMIKKIGKGKWYTVRRIEKSNEAQEIYDLTYVDVFIHGNSPGSLWAKNSKKGDILVSMREHPEKLLSMQEDGKILLIGDETAYPALAGFLENWKFAQAPFVILVANPSTDRAYFKDCKAPENTQFEWVEANYAEQVQKTLEKIDQLHQQNNLSLVWGALEAEAAKQIRVFLRTQLSMPNAKTIIKGYWTKE